MKSDEAAPSDSGMPGGSEASFSMETRAAYWRTCVLAARRAGLGHEDYLEVRYEDLILNTRETRDRRR